MDEFEVVLTQMPYVGGAASRMTDFFMRLIGFIAISRVLRRHGVSPSLIGDIERETYRAQLLIEPAADRLAEGRQFMSPENRRRLREQAAHSASEAHQREFPDDFVYEFVEPGPATGSSSASTTHHADSASSRRVTAIRRFCRTSAGSMSTPMPCAASISKGRRRWPAGRGIAISDSRHCRRTTMTWTAFALQLPCIAERERTHPPCRLVQDQRPGDRRLGALGAVFALAQPAIDADRCALGLLQVHACRIDET